MDEFCVLVKTNLKVKCRLKVIEANLMKNIFMKF